MITPAPAAASTAAAAAAAATVSAHLLKARIQPGNVPLSRDQLKSEVATFMAAGFETTSHAITWVLAALAAHQDIQQQMVEELAALGLAPAQGGATKSLFVHVCTSPLTAPPLCT